MTIRWSVPVIQGIDNEEAIENCFTLPVSENVGHAVGEGTWLFSRVVATTSPQILVVE